MAGLHFGRTNVLPVLSLSAHSLLHAHGLAAVINERPTDKSLTGDFGQVPGVAVWLRTTDGGNNEQFFHRESRSTIFIMWCISLIWIAFILLLLLGIFCNRPFLIIIHILFSIVLMVFEALLLAALIIYDAFSLPAKILFIVLIFVGVSVVIEWRCYRTMKTYL
ncbi:hypothetical protein QR680_001325 [Steinernema hermaphroditum]|uniref:Uncharacterized protein n=1 Tax=Steinernema hermaphroditum TaxID=289476 RepID=A0AA39GXS1_9BILA|nr:hypothetical protein QR680_001325 [Steinernema hermaphroditum]